MLPNPDSGKLKLVVRLGTGLSHELTVRRYLQEFAVEADRADIEWKLPERTHPVFDLYVPKDTALDLQLGKTDLLVKGVRGDKSVNAGKGTVRLAVTHSDLEYRAIVVDVAMGSFADLRFSGKQEHHVPFHTELPGQGSAKVHLQMAMGRVELTPEE